MRRHRKTDTGKSGTEEGVESRIITDNQENGDERKRRREEREITTDRGKC